MWCGGINAGGAAPREPSGEVEKRMTAGDHSPFYAMQYAQNGARRGPLLGARRSAARQRVSAISALFHSQASRKRSALVVGVRVARPASAQPPVRARRDILPSLPTALRLIGYCKSRRLTPRQSHNQEPMALPAAASRIAVYDAIELYAPPAVPVRLAEAAGNSFMALQIAVAWVG